MDAPSKALKHFALFFAIVMLVAVPGWAQSLVVNPNPVVLTGTNAFTPVSVSVTASDGSGIPFSVAVTSNTTPGFFSVSPNSATTPASLSVQLTSTAACSANPSACTGSFRVQPTAGTATAVDVTVQYTTTGGGGGNLITLTPSSTTTNAAIGGSALVSTQVSTTNASPLTFNVQSDQSWLIPGVSSATVSQSQPYTLNATANATGLTNQQYTGHLNITAGGQTATFTVTFNVGTGGGSGTVFTVSQGSVNLAYPNGPTTAFLTISSNNAAITTYNWIVNNANWLLVNGFASGSGAAVSSGISISLNTSVVATLPASLYTGQINIYNPPTGALDLTINVSLTVGSGGGGGGITVSPTTLTFTAPFGGSPTAAQTITISAPAGTSYTVKPQGPSGADFLRFNGQSCFSGCPFSGTQTIPVTAVPLANMFIGGYNDRIDITQTGNSSPSAFVSITFNVTSGAVGPLSFSPTSLNFSSAVGGSSQSQNLQVSTLSTTQWTVNPSVSWLTVTGASTTMTGSQNLTVTVTPTSLTANTYNGTLNFSSGGLTQQVPVTLVVGGGGGGGGTSTIAAPTNLTFAYQTNGSVPLGQALIIAPAGAYTISTPTASWINLSSVAGNGPAQIVVSVNPTGQTASTTPLTGSFTISTPSGSQTISASLLVTSSPVLQPSPSGDIIYQSGVSTYQVSLTPSDGSSQSASATTDVSWVTVTNQSVSGTQTTLFINVNPTGLCNGLNVGNINVNTSAANNPLVIPVVANVTNASTNCGTGGGTLTANPTSLTFSYQQGNASPAAQTVNVTSSTGSPIAFNVSATSTGGWLSASQNSTTTPATVTVSVSPGQLTPSSTPYTGTVTLTPTGGGTATTVSVSITVTAGASVTVTPNSLTFNVQAGSAASTQQLTVSGTSGATFSASASRTGWLSVSPASGTVPNTLTVSVDPSNLSPSGSPYSGTITVAGTGSSTGSTTVTVTVNVTAPLPTISKVGNAASFVVGALAPGEVIYLEGTALGPQTLVTAAVDQATGKLATTIGGVSVTIGGFAAPMVYASATKVSAIVPYELKGFSTATVLLKYLGQTSNGITFGVSTTAPGVFTANASGTGPAAALNPNLSANAPSSPAPKGGQVAVFITGEGETNPAGVTGKITVPNLSGVGPLTPVPLLNVTVLVDGQPAKAINYVGEVAGIVSGVLQVNFTIPDNARTGDLPLFVSVGSSASQQGVTISVR